MTRTIIDAIHDGSLERADYETMPIFDLRIPTHINGVESKMLNARNTWRNKEEYDEYLDKVANMFKDNFRRFEEHASEEVKAGGPKI